jgi:hypothetical protein
MASVDAARSKGVIKRACLLNGNADYPTALGPPA